ncbi:hypothetical protein MFMK1_002821 [Metallumcola ferriviriculae]|uniref:Uncharacterized protein n=1 Tax=Metallumcola ferriviriculae TaxID=3039180 RepID=A0AAU0UPX6_9FIRM|nr:hypothetical protein MFMK1_002821 [Desulfitibacteraceae bacterium MK1]
MKFKKMRVSWTEIFERWSETVEKYLIRTVVLGVLLLVVAQALALDEPANFYMGFSQLLDREAAEFNRQYPEARSVNAPLSAFATVSVRLNKFSALEKAKLLVNGKEVTDFRHPQVTVKVNSGDVISVDGSFYTHQLEFEIVGGTDNIAVPKINAKIEVEGDSASFAPVEVLQK